MAGDRMTSFGKNPFGGPVNPFETKEASHTQGGPKDTWDEHCNEMGGFAAGVRRNDDPEAAFRRNSMMQSGSGFAGANLHQGSMGGGGFANSNGGGFANPNGGGFANGGGGGFASGGGGGFANSNGGGFANANGGGFANGVCGGFGNGGGGGGLGGQRNPFQQGGAGGGGGLAVPMAMRQMRPDTNTNGANGGLHPMGAESRGDRFRKPAAQCPLWDDREHRSNSGCGLWHPYKQCLFFPQCRSAAADCGYAHPFCDVNGCSCPDGPKDPQLNHLGGGEQPTN